MFDRINLIQMVINKINAKVYMEIGVFNGYSFLNVRCFKKIGIDPVFAIKRSDKIKTLLKNPFNFFNKYFTMTSNDFFINKISIVKSSPPKVIFIDGLHTFEQTLQDCYNSLNYLAKGGVIILHDCNPPTDASSTPAQSIPEAKKLWETKNKTGWTDEWCGDTWKTIPFLIKNNPELNVSVLNTDYGLGIVSKKSDHENINYKITQNVDEYKKLNFSDLEINRYKMLNLSDLNQLDRVLDRHTR